MPFNKIVEIFKNRKYYKMLLDYFDWEFYLRIYPNLKESGINTRLKTIINWLKYGKNEGRLFCDTRETKEFGKNFGELEKQIFFPIPSSYYLQVAEKGKGWIKKFKNNAVFEEGFEKNDSPIVSIIIPVFNKIEYTLLCLKSLKENAIHKSLEIIIVNDCSTDQTRDILEGISGIHLINNAKNKGFIASCNAGAKKARGKYLLFLNNDTQLLEGTITYLVKTMKLDFVGAVGGKIILPNGRLQEAGSIIWKNGFCLGYGRGQNPENPEFNFVREVDYCSAALFMTSKSIWNEIGGFDTLYSPGYYEETDYCMKLRENGYRVMYQPLARIIHYEFTSSNRDKAIFMQKTNHKKFFARWYERLKTHLAPLESNIIKARSRSNQKRILYLDDRVPDPMMGRGYPRAYDILNKNIFSGYQITLYPLGTPHIENPYLLNEIQQKGVEIIINHHNFTTFLEERSTLYDVIFISRPNNMKNVLSAIQKVKNQAEIIYDVEAIFALRKIKFQEIVGNIVTDKEKEKLLKEETNLVKIADKTIVVSESEKKILEKLGIKNVSLLGHKINIKLTDESFENREGILFVGSIPIHEEHLENPNYDSLIYFINEVFPEVREKLQCNFYIIGTNQSSNIQDFADDHIKVIGKVQDLYKYHNRCKIFVVPTRFAAGIPYKLHEATSYGIPSVITEIIGKQVSWKDAKHCLIAKNSKDFSEKIIKLYNSKSLWTKLRENSLEDIRKSCNPTVFDDQVDKIFNLQ